MIDLYIDIINGKGRGVRTHNKIMKDTVIEIAPCIEVNENDIQNTILKDYSFGAISKNKSAVCFGYASMYNHSDEPNIYTTRYDKENKSYTFITLRDVDKNEELCIDYGYKNEGWV